jgi:hypothetical protein
MVQIRQEKKVSLVVQEILLAHTKNWANKEFLCVVIHDKVIAHTKMGRYAIFMGGTEMGTRILMSFPGRFCNQKKC